MVPLVGVGSPEWKKERCAHFKAGSLSFWSEENGRADLLTCSWFSLIQRVGTCWQRN